MRVTVYICFHSMTFDKVLETDNGEILHREFPTGALRHECWLHELEEEVKEQILEQIPISTNPNSCLQFIAA